MNRKYIIIVIFVLGIIIFWIFFKNDETEEFNILETNDATLELGIVETNNVNKNELGENKIKIHITGEVNNQGIIEINEGERIADAIEKAGGLTIKADVSKVNLAYVLEDGQKLYIPSIDDNNFNEIDIGSGENVIVGNDQKSREN